MLTGKQKRYLRSLASSEAAMFQIGKEALSDNLIHMVDQAFNTHELIKLRVLKTCPVDLVANEICQVIMITRNSIESSPYRDRMMNALTEMMADENIRQIHKIEILAERGLRDRVLVYLNILTVKSGSNTVTVKMSREQLAQYLCVNRSALSNELSKMKREGLIDFHKDQFTLLKPGAMFVSKEGLGDIPDE